MFVRWDGDVTAEQRFDAVITVPMDQSRTVTAIFETVEFSTATTRGYIKSSPLVADIDHDGEREIVIGDMAGYVYVFNKTGGLEWEYFAGDAFNPVDSPVPAYANPELRNNTALGNITIQSSPAMGDIDGDTIPEIIVGVGGFVNDDPPGGVSTGDGPVGQGGVLILNADGSLKLLMRGWDTYDGRGAPIQDGFADGFFSSPAIGDIDGDGVLDFSIGGTDQNIYALKTSSVDPSRNTVGDLIRPFNPPGRQGFFLQPVFDEDNDSDGRFDEDPVGDLTPMTFYNTADDIGGFNGVDDDNDGLTDEGGVGDDDEDSSDTIGFVDQAQIDEDEWEWPFRSLDTVVSSPALADLLGNGLPEVIIGADSSGAIPLLPERTFIPTGGAIRALNLQGDEIGSYSQPIEQVVFASPTAADVDNDGQMEVLHGTGTVFRDGSGELVGKALYCFNNDGAPCLPGNSPTGVFATTSDVIVGAPAVGDIDNDGQLEIAAADFAGFLYAWEANGSLLPGFPVQPLVAANFPSSSNRAPQIRSSVILADVDDDNQPEMVLGVGFAIVAINADGTVVPSFGFDVAPFTTGSTLVIGAPAFEDLDFDGTPELIWVTGESSNGGSAIDNGLVNIWSIGNSDRESSPWPQFKRVSSRTSALDVSISNPVFNPPLAALTAGATVNLAVDIASDRRSIQSATVTLEFASGNQVETLLDNGTGGDPVAADGNYRTSFSLNQDATSLRRLVYQVNTSQGSETFMRAVTLTIPATIFADSFE